MGDWGEKHEPRCSLAVIFLAIGFIHPLGQVGTVGIRAVVKRLVVTPERKDHVRLGNLEVRVGTRKVLVARSVVDLVAGKAVITEHQFLFGHRTLHVALEPAVMLHTLCERIADEHNMLALFQVQRLAGGHRAEANSGRCRQTKEPCFDGLITLVHR